MNIQEKYAKLVAELGDTQYKLETLQEKRAELMADIKMLDGIAGMLKEASRKQANVNAQKTETEKSSV